MHILRCGRLCDHVSTKKTKKNNQKNQTKQHINMYMRGNTFFPFPYRLAAAAFARTAAYDAAIARWFAQQTAATSSSGDTKAVVVAAPAHVTYVLCVCLLCACVCTLVFCLYALALRILFYQCYFLYFSISSIFINNTHLPQ